LLGEEAKASEGFVGAKGILASRFPLTLLLAEDNRVNQKVILRMFQILGYEADLAENGAQALEALRRKAYDLVFMDVHMPEMDGLEATRRICQEWPESSRPSILALTAGAFDDNRAECIAAGMSGFIAKPVRLAELAAAIETFAINRA
jgi:CheY-like chemotaxis protein